jgi:titin
LWNTGNLDSAGAPTSRCPHQVTVPAPPRELGATGSGSQISLTWAAPSSDGGSAVTSYEVLRGNSPAGEGSTPIGTVTGTTFTDHMAAPGDTYYYEVVAVNAAGVSEPSDEASALRQTVPSPPVNVIATGGNASATLIWTAPDDDGGSPVVSYTVSTSGAGASPVTVAASACSGAPPTCRATMSALGNGTPYTFSVVATNALGGSTPATSNAVTPNPP